MILEDGIGSFFSNLYSRIMTPLSGAFIFSWVIWNYEFILISFSGAYIEKKIELIERLYTFNPLLNSWFYFDFLPELLLGLLLPFLSALFFIFIYPMAAAAVYRKHLSNQKELLNLKRESDKSKLLTIEEHNQWLINAARLEQEQEQVTNEKNQKIMRLEALIEDYKGQIDEYEEKSKNTPSESSEAQAMEINLDTKMEDLDKNKVEHKTMLEPRDAIVLAAYIKKNSKLVDTKKLEEASGLHHIKYENSKTHLIKAGLLAENNTFIKATNSGAKLMSDALDETDKIKRRLNDNGVKQKIVTNFDIDNKSDPVTMTALALLMAEGYIVSNKQTTHTNEPNADALW